MKKQPSLLFCIVMDIIGSGSFIIPILGEFTDVIWAPLSAIIFLYTFGIKKGKAGSIFNFVEEILPGTDFIPTFTIMWLWQYFSERNNNVIQKEKPYQARLPGKTF